MRESHSINLDMTIVDSYTQFVKGLVSVEIKFLAFGKYLIFFHLILIVKWRTVALPFHISISFQFYDM